MTSWVKVLAAKSDNVHTVFFFGGKRKTTSTNL